PPHPTLPYTTLFRSPPVLSVPAMASAPEQMALTWQFLPGQLAFAPRRCGAKDDISWRSVATRRQKERSLRIAVDTGGTFTDCVWMENGQLQTLKVFSTP